MVRLQCCAATHLFAAVNYRWMFVLLDYHLKGQWSRQITVILYNIIIMQQIFVLSIPVHLLLYFFPQQYIITHHADSLFSSWTLFRDCCLCSNIHLISLSLIKVTFDRNSYGSDLIVDSKYIDAGHRLLPKKWFFSVEIIYEPVNNSVISCTLQVSSVKDAAIKQFDVAVPNGYTLLWR